MRGWLVVTAALAGCGQTPTSDWERQQEGKLPPEAAAPLPPYPPRGELLGFSVAASREFRFFIDAGSLSVGSDGVVRYVLIARSDSGVDNVSFEGMRCASGEVRIYAVGRDGRWSGQPGAWRPIQLGVQRWHDALYREYFCRQRQAVRDAKEGIDALRN